MTAAGDLLAGRYELVRALASGGMGEVWVGHDVTDDGQVAVKVMHLHAADQNESLARFRDEIRHAGSLDHPHIVAVVDQGEHEGLPFLVMELVDGPTLRELLDAGPLGPEEAASVLHQAAQALSAAHDAGLVHRDVKPANILVSADGTIKLTDFGLSRALDSAGYTRTGMVMGSVYYISPEQARGGTATPLSDLYALGAVGFEMLTGDRLFHGDSPAAVAMAHISQQPPPLPESCPPELAELVTACLAKEPDERPASAADLVAALERTGLVSHEPPPPPAHTADPDEDVDEDQSQDQEAPEAADHPGHPEPPPPPAEPAHELSAAPEAGGNPNLPVLVVVLLLAVALAVAAFVTLL